MSKKHWAEIDGMYAIGAILVVLGHSHSSDWSTFAGTILDPLLTFIYSFHMPLFFFVAGFLLCNSDAIRYEGYLPWLEKKAERLLTPYAVLTVAAMIPKYWFEHRGFSGFSIGYLVQILLVPRMSVWGHLWFLPTLFLLYALVGYTVPFAKGKPKNLFFVTWLIVGAVLYVLPIHTDLLCLNDLRNGLLMFCVGMCWRRIIKPMPGLSTQIRLALSGIGVAAAWFLVPVIGGSLLGKLLIALGMIAACWLLSGFLGKMKLCRWISHHNFTIYMYSWPAQAVVMAAVGRMRLPWYGTSVLMLCAGWLVPVIMVAVYERLKILHSRFLNLVLGMK